MSPLLSNSGYSFATATTYPKIVTNGLVINIDAFLSNSYPGSGSNIKDLSGNNQTGSLKNGTLWSSGGYFSLDGSNDYILVNNNGLSSYFPSTAESHFTWVYPVSAGQIVSEIGQTTINTGWHDSNIELSSGGVFRFSTWQGVNGLTNKVVSTAQSFYQWYQVGYTYDGSTFTAYINGNSIGTTTFTRSVPWENGRDLYYALCATDSTNMGSSGYAGARISQFLLYNRALTSTEVKQNFDALKGRYRL